MGAFAVRIELPDDVAIERLHDADPRDHGRAIVLGHQDQAFHRRLPLVRILIGFGKLQDIRSGIAQGAESEAIGQLYRLFRMLLTRPLLVMLRARHATPPSGHARRRQ
jgi:hypothetical protein